MSWRTKASSSDELFPASFRGISFEVKSDDATMGRRTQLFEFPNRDKPYVEDLGRSTRKFSITAYVIGKDWMSKRDKLIKAFEQFGPGKLVHPFYGSMTVSVADDIRVSHSSDELRTCQISFNCIESGDLEFPTAGRATLNQLFNSNSALADYLNNLFSGFSMSSLSDFTQSSILSDAAGYLDTVDEAFTLLDSGISAASRLLKGDLSVILSGSSMSFVTSLQSMWRSANRLSGDSKSLLKLVNGLTGVTTGHDLSPRGVWKSSSSSTRDRVTKSNQISQAMRVSALSTAAYTVTLLPSQSSVSRTSKVSKSVPVVSDIETADTTVYPTYSELKKLRSQLNTALDTEMARVTDDGLFQALQQVRTDINLDIAQRLATATKTISRTPTDVLPAVVLAYSWFGDATRVSEITQRNDIAHPGFVPAASLTVPQE